MRFKVLIENTVSQDVGYICEHGLSIYIEFEDKKILLDAGKTGAFIDNAKNMAVDLSKLDFAVLSHGHYDHSDGFDRFLKEYRNINIFGLENITGDYYSGSGGEIHYIGLSKEMYEHNKDRFILLNGMTKICENVYVIPHNTKGLKSIGERCKLYKMDRGEYVPDDFLHELSLVFDTPEGLVVFNSCSHAGIVSIFKEVEGVFKDKKICAFVGGLHMKGSINGTEVCIYTDEELEGISRYILEKNNVSLYTCHCTGRVAFEKLESIMKGKIEYISTGDDIVI